MPPSPAPGTTSGQPVASGMLRRTARLNRLMAFRSSAVDGLFTEPFLINHRRVEVVLDRPIPPACVSADALASAESMSCCLMLPDGGQDRQMLLGAELHKRPRQPGEAMRT